ncbi:MAG: sensor histidine kinase [Oscillospiraceae bacterium]
MSDILWGVFETLVNLYQGVIVTYFIYKYLGDKKGREYLHSPAMLYAVLLTVAVTMINAETVFEHFYALIYVVIIFVYSLISLKGTILKKFFASVFPALILLISTAFIGNIATVLFNKNLYYILSGNTFERFISILAVQLLVLYLVMLSLRVLTCKNTVDNELVMTEWILISVVLLISIAIGAILNLIVLNPDDDHGAKYVVIAFAGIILINIAVCYLVVDLSKKNKAVRENEALKLAQEYSRQYTKNAEIEYDAIRKMRHDFKDYFSVIYTLLKNNNVELAISNIEKNIGALSDTGIFIRTNNDIVNAVINAKLSTAKSFGIDSTCLSVMDFDGIDDLDLCRLLSNMLENAITACNNIKEGEKRIYIKITDDGYNYTFNLKNTIEGSVISNNHDLKTTKPEKDLHGFGTQIIRDISLKYNGRCDFYEENGCFCCNVILSK